MAFNFFRWILGTQAAPTAVTDGEFFDLFADTYIRELAFGCCANLVANAISKCEVKTYVGNEERKEREYYLWNFEPNQNQNSTAFWQKLVHTMYRDREALVIENGGKVYVADSYTRKKYALYDDVFSQVAVGDFTFNRTFTASEVLFFELSAENMKRITDGLYASYGKLIRCGMRGYQKSRGEHGTLTLDTSIAGDKKFQETYEAIKNEGFKKFVESENGMLPLYKGMKYDSLTGGKQYNADTTRDIRAMIDDVTDFTARGFGIPPVLLNGSVQDVNSATSQLLTFCVDPLADNLAEEINRKRNGYANVAKGTYHRIDTSSVKHIDLLDAAGSIDKLISSGCECINDIRVLLGQPIIPEPWAYEHYITKNYATVAELLRQMEGAKP